MFLGGALRDGGPFQGWREEIIKAAKEITPDIRIVQVSLVQGPKSLVEAAKGVEKELEV